MDFPIGVKQKNQHLRPDTLRYTAKGKMPAATVKRIYFMRLRKRPYREIGLALLPPAHLFPFKPARQSVYHKIDELALRNLPKARSFVPNIPDDEAHCRQIQIPRQKAKCWQEKITEQTAFCNQVFFPGNEARCEMYIFKQPAISCFSWQKILPAAGTQQLTPQSEIAEGHTDDIVSKESETIAVTAAKILRVPLAQRQAACAHFALKEPEITRAFTIPMLVLPPQRQIYKFVFGLSALRFYSLKAHLPEQSLEDIITVEAQDFFMLSPGTMQPCPAYEIREAQASLAFDDVSAFTETKIGGDIRLDPELQRMLTGAAGSSSVDILQTGEMAVRQARRYEIVELDEAKTYRINFSGKAAAAKRQRLIELFQNPPIFCDKNEDEWRFFLDLQNMPNIKAVFLNNIEVPAENPVAIDLNSNHIKLLLQNNGTFSAKIGGDSSYYWFRLDEKLQRGQREENPTTGNYLLIVPQDWKCDNPEAKCFNGLPLQQLGLDHWKGYRVRVNSRNSEFPKFRLFNGMTRMCRWLTTGLGEDD